MTFADPTLPCPALALRDGLDDALAARYTPRIRRHAARYARRLPPHIAVADLVSAGFEGLVDAFVRHDRARGDHFEAYVDHRIRGAILDELRDNDPLTRDQRAFTRRIAVATRSLASRLGRAPDEHEVADELGLGLDAFHHQLSRMTETAARSSAAAYDETSDEATDSMRAAPDEAAEQGEQWALVLRAMSALTERQQHVLRSHYERGMSMREIATSLAVTESRISQIHSEAIARLRQLLCND